MRGTTTSSCGRSRSVPRGWTTLERALNPVLGKSLVVYGEKVGHLMNRCDTRCPRSRASSPRSEVSRDRRRDRGDPAARRQHPVDPRRPHRPVEPRRSGDGARRRRPPRRGRARRTSGCARCSGPTARGTRTTWVDAGQGRRARHQRHVLHRQRRLAPLPRAPATPRSSSRSGPSSSAPSTSRSTTSTRPARSRGAATSPGDGALLTGSSSIYSSLRCAIAIAERLGRERPDWELSLGSLAIAIAHRPDVFLDKDRWAMDWYYPILGGVLRGHAAARAARREWDTFVVAGPRRALRVRPAVGHRGRDVRARDGARRASGSTTARASCSRGCSSCATTTVATGPA